MFDYYNLLIAVKNIRSKVFHSEITRVRVVQLSSSNVGQEYHWCKSPMSTLHLMPYFTATGKFEGMCMAHRLGCCTYGLSVGARFPAVVLS
jgi:hypothetical protein